MIKYLVQFIILNDHAKLYELEQITLQVTIILVF